MIRRAVLSDIDSIVKFIKFYWNQNHIYVVDRNFFHYEFVNNKNVNFIISIDTNQEINGILGFIQYDDEDKISDIFTAMWMVKPNVRNPLVGPDLIKFLLKSNFTYSLSTIGLSLQAYTLLKIMKFYVGEMNHFYCINPKLKKYNLIKYKNIDSKQTPNPEDFNTQDNYLHEYESEVEILNVYNSLKKSRPIKSTNFFQKKYLQNPYYKYKFFGVIKPDDKAIVGLVIIRKVEYKGSSALRIVDYFGDQYELAKTRVKIIELLDFFKSEYIDLYQYGMDEAVLNFAGFTKNKYEEDVIIPNYFEPFECKNIKINFSTTLNENYFFFKGDGDQDRPNLIA